MQLLPLPIGHVQKPKVVHVSLGFAVVATKNEQAPVQIQGRVAAPSNGPGMWNPRLLPMESFQIQENDAVAVKLGGWIFVGRVGASTEDEHFVVDHGGSMEISVDRRVSEATYHGPLHGV